MYSAVRLMQKLYNIKHAKVHPFPSPPPKKTVNIMQSFINTIEDNSSSKAILKRCSSHCLIINNLVAGKSFQGKQRNHNVLHRGRLNWPALYSWPIFLTSFHAEVWHIERAISRERVSAKPSPTCRYHRPFVCMLPVTDQSLWGGFCFSTEQPINVVTSKWCWREGNHIQAHSISVARIHPSNHCPRFSPSLSQSHTQTPTHTRTVCTNSLFICSNWTSLSFRKCITAMSVFCLVCDFWCNTQS